jgi:hypothetical protein
MNPVPFEYKVGVRTIWPWRVFNIKCTLTTLKWTHNYRYIKYLSVVRYVNTALLVVIPHIIWHSVDMELIENTMHSCHNCRPWDSIRLPPECGLGLTTVLHEVWVSCSTTWGISVMDLFCGEIIRFQISSFEDSPSLVAHLFRFSRIRALRREDPYVLIVSITGYNCTRV